MCIHIASNIYLIDPTQAQVGTLSSACITDQWPALLRFRIAIIFKLKQQIAVWYISQVFGLLPKSLAVVIRIYVFMNSTPRYQKPEELSNNTLVTQVMHAHPDTELLKYLLYKNPKPLLCVLVPRLIIFTSTWSPYTRAQISDKKHSLMKTDGVCS